MDYQHSITSQLQPDDLQQVAGLICTDREHPWWVGVSIEIDHYHRMVECVPDCVPINPVLMGRPVDFHTGLV